MKKERSKLLDLIDGYEIPREHRNEKGEPIAGTGVSFFSRSITGSLSGKRSFSSKKIFVAVNNLARRFLYTPSRVYGIALLTFGILSAVIDLAFVYFEADAYTHTALISGLVTALLGILLIFSESPIAIAAEDFVLTDYLLFEFFCIKRMQKSRNAAKGFHPYLGIVFGALLAAFGVWWHPLQVLFAVGLVLFTILSLASPEFSFLVTLLVLPYTKFFADTTLVLAALLLITFVSFMRKVISGKRVYVFEQYDILIGIMIIFVLISGIFIKGMASFENSVMLVLGAFGYIMTSNLVTNRRLADRVSTAIMLSSVPSSLYVIVAFIKNAVGGVYKYTGTGFYSPFVLGAFLIVAILLTVSLLKEAKYAASKAVYLSALFLQLATLVLCGNFMALLALVIGIFCYFIFSLRKLSAIPIIVIIAVMYVPFLLPSAWLEGRAVSVIFGHNVTELLALWGASFKMFLAHPFIGIGMGAESFSEEIVKYGVSAPNSSNIFLEIACEAGVFALIFFLLVLFTCLRHRGKYRSYVRASQVRTISGIAVTALVCLVIYGTVNYIWEESSMCYLFWCVFGLGSATLRIAKREHDDKIIYYNDVVSSETSDIDVQIDGFNPVK